MRSLFGRLINSRSVASGAVMYITMRWFDRLVGIVSTVVLARLLTPGDFGIVALASIVLGLAVVLLDLGINIVVVRQPGLDRDDLDTAWTLRLLHCALIAAFLALAAPLAAAYYHDPRLAPVLTVSSVTYLLSGLTGMGPTLFQRRQQYAREVSYVMLKRLGGFTVTLILAVWLRSYWAMILGSLAGCIWGVLLSHAMQPLPVRLTLVRWRRFVGASAWLTFGSIGRYVATQIDRIVIGARDGATVLGNYSLAAEIAAMPTTELLAPMGRALFPALASLQDELLRLRHAFLYALGIQASLALPVGIGLALVSTDLVTVMLGEKWLDAAPLMTALALAFAMNALTHSGTYLLTSLGRFRALTVSTWMAAAVLALAILVAFPKAQAVQIAWFRAALAASGVFMAVWLTVRALPVVSVADIARAMLRPIIGTSLMAVCVWWVGSAAGDTPPVIRLLLQVAAGAAIYPLCLLGLWHGSGRPAGAEQWLLERSRSILRS